MEKNNNLVIENSVLINYTGDETELFIPEE